MNIISRLNGVSSVSEALKILLQSPNALDYDVEELKSRYNNSCSEMKGLSMELCGVANYQLAMSFMSFCTPYPLEFFNNVSFNSDNSIPLVVRVINIALSNEYERERVKELEQASIEN